MWKSVLVPAVGILVLPLALHGQCKAHQGSAQQGGRGMQMGGGQMQMGGGQGGQMGGMHMGGGQGGQMGGMQMGGGQGGQMGGMQMGGGQQQGGMHRNLVRDLLAESAALELTAEQVQRLEPLAERLDRMNAVFEGMHQTGVGRTLTTEARDSMRTAHMGVRQTNEQEVLKEMKVVLGADLYVKALELLVVRGRGMN